MPVVQSRMVFVDTESTRLTFLVVLCWCQVPSLFHCSRQLSSWPTVPNMQAQVTIQCPTSHLHAPFSSLSCHVCQQSMSILVATQVDWLSVGGHASQGPSQAISHWTACDAPNLPTSASHMQSTSVKLSDLSFE